MTNDCASNFLKWTGWLSKNWIQNRKPQFRDEVISMHSHCLKVIPNTNLIYNRATKLKVAFLLTGLSGRSRRRQQKVRYAMQMSTHIVKIVGFKTESWGNTRCLSNLLSHKINQTPPPQPSQPTFTYPLLESSFLISLLIFHISMCLSSILPVGLASIFCQKDQKLFN